jgi:hypothetical protein
VTLGSSDGDSVADLAVELDCRMESACETCASFGINVQFLPARTQQCDHARERGQTRRAALLDGLIRRVEAGGGDQDA